MTRKLNSFTYYLVNLPTEAELELIDNLKPVPGLVVLVCGVAGSGKTTFSRKLESAGFKRLSIDEIVWEMFGRFGVDFRSDDYPQKLNEARAMMRERLIQLLDRQTPTVIDSAFWSRSSRDEYKTFISNRGGSWKLVYLKASYDLLKRRLAERNERVDAHAPFAVTEMMLQKLLRSFEEPVNEGEITLIYGSADAQKIRPGTETN